MSKYVSTRDFSGKTLGYLDVLLQGLAPDRGLYVPTHYPLIDEQTLTELSQKSYVDLFTYIKGLFVGDDILPETQAALAERAYSTEKFPHTQSGNVTPVTNISSGFFVQQLSLGPTAAFKDMALQPLGQDIQHVLSERGKTLTILGATSGDTGSAAEAAFKGLKNVKLFMLSPQEGMSDFQKAQMGALSGGNILNISIPGRFDDCQDIVKAVKQDPEFADLGAVNSINWGRIASQVPYYFSGYLQTVGKYIGKPVDFVVPTGNFGNVLAGYVARKMGLPIRKLIVATNENDVLNTLIQTGVYSRPAPKVTTSPSMDITVASNYERLVYDIFNGDTEKVRQYMSQFELKNTVSFKDFGLPDDTLQQLGFDSGTSTAEDRLDSIRWAYETSGDVIDPHTADAFTVARRKQVADVPIICMSTALPVKFEPTIEQALGFVTQREERFVGLEKKVTGGFVIIPNSVDEVKSYIRTNIAA